MPPAAPTLSRRRFLAHTAAALAAPRAFASAAPSDPTTLSLTEAAAHLRAGTLTSTALTRACLDRIDQLNPRLNAFITVPRAAALAEAAQLDRERAAGHTRGPLHGLPLAIKDNINTANLRTTVASALFDDQVPLTDAPVVAELRRAGALVLGKTNLHEFAMGGSSATSYFGPVHNPWALDRVAGGSSGGSAAAVSALLAPAALGTDTGGSIRIPASFCGVTGLKPTFGLVPVAGIFPLIPSLDHCGPIARSAADCALLLSSMAAYDEADLSSVDRPREDFLRTMTGTDTRSLRLGIPRAGFFDHLDPDTAAAFEAALRTLAPLVHSIADCTLPSTSDLPWTTIRAAEVWSIHQQTFLHQSGLYSLQTRRVVAGTEAELNNPDLTPATKAADLIRAQAELAHLRRAIDHSFSTFDLVLLPTMRSPARTIAHELAQEEDPGSLQPKDREPEITSNSLPFNLFGIPALSVPCGLTSSGPAGTPALPIGLMIAGPHFADTRCLALGDLFQRHTDFHRQRPPLT